MRIIYYMHFTFNNTTFFNQSVTFSEKITFLTVEIMPQLETFSMMDNYATI